MMDEKARYNINDISFRISSFAVQSMIYEVSCFPSPGLVSPVSTGAHDDMNYYTFVDSTCALIKYLTLFVQEGFKVNSEKELFEDVRRIGIEAEKDMFAKTNGVNTQKGMLFLMGIACSAVGRVISEHRGFDGIRNVIMGMAAGLVENELASLDRKNDMSHGEDIYLKYKAIGIRGEAEKGMPTVFDFSLDFYHRSSDLNINDRLVHTLIAIMQVCEDTTIIYRHSPEVLTEVQNSAKEIMRAGGMRTGKGREMIEQLCDEFVKRHISPGGSADMLGITVFMDLVKRYMANGIC